MFKYILQQCIESNNKNINPNDGGSNVSKSVVCVACTKPVPRHTTQFVERLGRRVCVTCKDQYDHTVAGVESDNDTDDVSKIVQAVSSVVRATPSVNLTEVGDALKEGIDSFLDGNVLFTKELREKVRSYEHEVIDRAIANFVVFKDKYLAQSNYAYITN